MAKKKTDYLLSFDGEPMIKVSQKTEKAKKDWKRTRRAAIAAKRCQI